MPNPTTNADNLPPIPLTEDQRYLFDTRGWVLIPSVLSESEIQEMREFCYQLKQEPASIPEHYRYSIGVLIEPYSGFAALRESNRSSGCARIRDERIFSLSLRQRKLLWISAGRHVSKGRKRHLLVDTSGLLRQVVVTAADVEDRDGLKQVDMTLSDLTVAVKKTHKIDLEVVAKQGPGFEVLPRRWVVERTFAWLMNFRRHARDYEVLTHHSEALIQIAMIHLLLKRIK